MYENKYAVSSALLIFLTEITKAELIKLGVPVEPMQCSSKIVALTQNYCGAMASFLASDTTCIWQRLHSIGNWEDPTIHASPCMPLSLCAAGNHSSRQSTNACI